MCTFPSEKSVRSSYQKKDKLEHNDWFCFYINGAILFLQKADSALHFSH